MFRLSFGPRFTWAIVAIGLLCTSAGPAAWAFQPDATEKKEAEPAKADEAKANPAKADPAKEPAKADETKETTPPATPAAPALTIEDVKVMADTLWVMLTGMLVFFMNLGFACVESGMCRAKNAVNILSKNFIVFAVTAMFFWFLGWGVMFGNDSGHGLFGTEGLLMVNHGVEDPAVGPYKAINWTSVPLWCKFFFQLVFAGTAATIVSGAVAERIKYLSFIVFSGIMAIAIYPVVGHWIWGGGWLAARGFADFAGSTQVHSVGGWAALVGAFLLGPRIGKYSATGKPQAIPGHNLTAATIGCLVLWFGWFGFNPGSTMAVIPGDIARIAVTTNSAGAAATLSATLTCWLLLGKPDLGMTLNGCLAGLVAITAACAFVTVEMSIVIGLVAGVLVVFAVLAFDRIKIDDPVGATSVHLVNGVFGTICVGLFGHPDFCAKNPAGEYVLNKPGLFYGGGTEQLIDQLIGVAATGGYVLVASGIAWLIIKYTIGMRVSKEEEIEGLDIGEHGNEAYHGFVLDRSTDHS